MKIAIAIDELNEDAKIPEMLEESAGLLVINDENGEKAIIHGAETSVIISSGCEAIVCGNIREDELFREITGHGIVKFFAAGMKVDEALSAMKRYELPLLTDRRRDGMKKAVSRAAG